MTHKELLKNIQKVVIEAREICDRIEKDYLDLQVKVMDRNEKDMIEINKRLEV